MERVSLLGWYHLAAFGVLVPFLALRTRQRLIGSQAAPLDRMQHFQTTVVTLALFGGFSWLTARREHLDLFSADFRKMFLALPAAVGMYAACVVYMRPRWRRAVEKRVRIVHLYMPSNRTERAWWLAVSILAGISEEITWRGVQTTLLAEILGSGVAAAIVCAMLFGLAHAVQGWRSALVITVFALGFQGLVSLSGSLYLAMAVHAVYDITAGLMYGRLGRQLGYHLAEGGGLSSTPSHASGTSL